MAVAEGAAGASGEACVPSPILRSALLGKRITPTDGAKVDEHISSTSHSFASIPHQFQISITTYNLSSLLLIFLN